MRSIAPGSTLRRAGRGAPLRCIAALLWIVLLTLGQGAPGASALAAASTVALGTTFPLPALSGPETPVAPAATSDEGGPRVIVQLGAPPAAVVFGAQLAADGQDSALARANGSAVRHGGPALQAEMSAYLDALETTQADVAAEVASVAPGAEVIAAYQWAFNGLAVRLPDGGEDALAALRAMPDVRAVYEEVTYRPALFSSLEAMANGRAVRSSQGGALAINAPGAVAGVGGQGQAGEGVRIAILDNGIDITHPMFDPSTFVYPAGFPRGDDRYTTPKVIVARAYFRPTDPPLEGEATPAPGPFASGHGTHVAGVAAGLPVTATVDGLSLAISGVAPRAHLMNYRIFYPSERTETEEARSVEVLKALDDAIADGADIILSSWVSASPRLPHATAEAVAVRAAIEAGIVVVSAAGNDGPTYGSASRLLGGYDPTIAVGAVTKSPTIIRNVLDVTGPGDVPDNLEGVPLGLALFGAELDELFGPQRYVSVADIGGGAFRFACGPLPVGSLHGQIALVERGECPFADKVFYAQQAGAVAVIIRNTEETMMDFACAGDFCDPGEIRIPAVMVAQSVGEDLASWRTRFPTATLQLDPRPRLVDTLAGVVWENSARGPAFMRYLKPDLVAPGVAVLSAGYDAGAQTPPYVALSGTSVAAAHVAGAAAMLLQANPGWGHAEVKAALMGTATVDGLWADADAVVPAGVLARGAGLIDLAQAATPALLVDPPSISLPEVRAGRTYTVPLSITDTRTAGETLTFTPAANALGTTFVTGMITVAVPGAVQVAPGATVTTSVRVTVNPAAGSGDATADLFFTSGTTVIRVPLWARVAPVVEAADVLLIDNDFSNFGAFVDYARVITPMLEALPYSYSYWDADLRFDSPQTIPDLPTLQRYPIIIWLTGDNKSPFGTFVVDTPLTPTDLQLLASYLDGGGRLLAIGQNLAQASDVNPNPDPTFGRADLYHHYLGAHWLQGNVFAPNDAVVRPPSHAISVVGLGGLAIAMHQVALDLGLEGDGEGNQTSIDEIAPGGLPDGSDLDLVQPILQAVNARPIAAGHVGIAKWDAPTIEDRTPDIPYRTLYFSFGIEGVNNRDGLTTRTALLRRALDWLSDEVTVELLPTVAGVRDLTRLEARATSSVGSPIVRYRWQIASGEAVLETATSSEPFIHVVFPAAGDYTVTVEATSELGHSAVAEDVVTAVPGGGSKLVVDKAVAAPGDILMYRAILRNTAPATITVAFSLTVPANTTHISHAGNGATFDAGTKTLTFAGPLGPNTTHELRLTVRIGDDVAPGTVIVATGRFAVDAQTSESTARTIVRQRTWFPIIAKNTTIP